MLRPRLGRLFKTGSRQDHTDQNFVSNKLKGLSESVEIIGDFRSENHRPLRNRRQRASSSRKRFSPPPAVASGLFDDLVP